MPAPPLKEESEEGPGEEHNKEDDEEQTEKAEDNDTERSGVRKRVGIDMIHFAHGRVCVCLSGGRDPGGWGMGGSLD